MEADNGTTCPYLGLKEDPETCLTFPSVRHCCKNALPPNSPALEQQSSFCLNPNYAACVVFVSAMPVHLPNAARAASPLLSRNKLNWGILGVAVIGLAILLGWWQLGGAFSPSSQATLTPLVAQARFTAASPAIVQAAFTSTPLQPEASATPGMIYLPRLSLEEIQNLPEGPVRAVGAYPEPEATSTADKCQTQAGWVSYTVQGGDTLYELALATHTTVAEIQQANCMSNTVIRVGQKLLLPSQPPKSAAPTRTPQPPKPTREPPPTPTDAPTAYPYP